MHFKVETTYTKAGVEELYDVASATTQRKLNRFPQIFFRIGGIVLLVMGVILVAFGGTPAQIAVAFIAGAVALVYHKLTHKLMIAVMWKSTPKDRLNNTFAFDDEKMAGTDGQNEVNMTYDKMFAVYETENSFFVFPSKNQSYVMPKTDFTIGRAEDFAKFIEEKTGKKPQFIALKK